MSRQRPQAQGMALAALCGIGAALAILSTPVGLVEMIVASTGLSEALPAAAPPLGLKARLLMAGFAAVMTIGLMLVLRRQSAAGNSDLDEQPRTTGAEGARKMGFALSKLTAMARGRFAPPVDQAAPILRRADAHPDAPSRAPIFASRDFNGLDIFARTEPGRRQLVVNAEADQEPLVPATGLAMPSAPAPLPDAELPSPAFARPLSTPAFARPLPDGMSPTPPEDAAFEALFDSEEGQKRVEPAMSTPMFAAPSEPVRAPSTHGLSIAELTERLERGLSQRARAAAAASPPQVIADMPVVTAVPVRDAVTQDMDEALRAALGTLRTMAGRAR